jgi:Phage integrase, N-terminal SAM-like domain
MSDKPIGDLRRRMIADMTVRSFGDKTQHDYIRHIETFARFLGRSPDTATGDDIRRFQLSQVEQGAQPPKMNTQASALRFFFTITLGRADLAHQLARTHYPRKLPRVLAREQVARLIEAAPGPGLKYKTALSIAYGAGLRGGEVVMAGRRHRFQADADPCRAGQRPQGSACHAVAAASLVAPRMVVAVPVERLAVSGSGLAAANNGAPAQPRLPHGGRGRGARQLGHAAYAAPLVRHASAGERYRRAGDSSAARSRDILPANTRSRGGFTIRFIPGAARPCSLSGNMPTVVLSWS